MGCCLLVILIIVIVVVVIMKKKSASNKIEHSPRASEARKAHFALVFRYNRILRVFCIVLNLNSNDFLFSVHGICCS